MPTIVFAQSAHIAVDDPDYYLINRLTTLSGTISDSTHTFVQPLDNRSVAAFMQQARLYNNQKGWSKTDNSNIAIALSNTGEWSIPDGMGAIDSKIPLSPFYEKITDFLYYNKKDFFISFNPVLGTEGIFDFEDNGSGSNDLFKPSFYAGAKLRAKYKDILGLEFSTVYANEYPSREYQLYNSNRNTVIGTSRKMVYDTAQNRNSYLLPTGSIGLKVLKNHISLNVGYDFLKMGDGYRSLMLSDFSGPIAYANIKTKVWKLQYDNLFLRLSPDKNIPGNLLTLNTPNFKFAAAHQLSVNVNKWLNIGLYEMTVFSRSNHFEVGYLNPIIFYRAVERSLGSPDKVAIGINAKAIAAKHFRIYGQFLINEFTASEFFANNGYIHNKWGAQLGFNYYDMFGVSNLDMQLEANVIRPYTFQHSDRGIGYLSSNFTNNNLPLGHPLGAGFQELIARVQYQPGIRWHIEAKALWYKKGVDTGGYNLGNDLSNAYNRNILSTHGVKMINGDQLGRFYAQMKVTYLIAPNLFADFAFSNGSFTYESKGGTPNYLLPDNKDRFNAFLSLRLNMPYKDYFF